MPITLSPGKFNPLHGALIFFTWSRDAEKAEKQQTAAAAKPVKSARNPDKVSVDFPLAEIGVQAQVEATGGRRRGPVVRKIFRFRVREFSADP